MVYNLLARCRGYSQMRVKTRRDRGGLEPKSKRGRRKRERAPITQNRRSDYARPWITQGHGPTTQSAQKDNNTDRRDKQMYTYIYEQPSNQSITTRDGARNRYERTGRRTGADARSLRRTKGENRSEVLQDALGAFLETARASSEPAQEAMEQKTESEQEEREAPRSVRQHFVLSARDDFFFVVLFLL